MNQGLATTLGLLSLRVAHQLNNLLNVVHANAEMLERDPTQLALMSAAIRRAAVQGARLTRSQMRLAEAHFQVERLELAEQLPAARELLEAVLGPRTAVSIEVGVDAGDVAAAPGALLLALVQLAEGVREARGAGDARGRAGHLHVLARTAGPDDLETRPPGSGPFAAVLVTHDGPGDIDDDGLAPVRRFCEAAGGQLWMRSTAGFGATVALLLPQLGDGRDTARLPELLR